LAVRIEHHGGGIAREACRRKCIDLKNTQGILQTLGLKFCTHPGGKLHFNQPWGG
jgi:hypothetical protein